MNTVSLRPMSAGEFGAWLARSSRGYAEDRAKADDRPLSETLPEAEAMTASMLPDGQATAGHLFFRILDQEVGVGWLWLGPQSDDAGVTWIYDIEVEESARGRGIGRAAMLAAEGEARAQGARDLALNVFGHNPNALSLYQSLGYQTVAIRMRKPVG